MKKTGFRIEIQEYSKWDDNTWKMLLFPMEFDHERQRWTGQGCSESYAGNALAHLVIEYHGRNNDPTGYQHYEFRLKEIYAANTGEVVAMAKLMESIDRALKKAREEDGKTQSFGQYCLRIAKAVKAQVFLFPKLNDWNDQEWNVKSMADGQEAIDWEIRQWQESDKKAAA